MACCGKRSGEQAVDPATNKPVVKVGAGILDAPTSAAAAASAFGTPIALSRLPPFFFVKMPDPEPEEEVQEQTHPKEEVMADNKDAYDQATPISQAGYPGFQQKAGGRNMEQADEYDSRDVASFGLRPDQSLSSVPPPDEGGKVPGQQIRPGADFYSQGPLQPNSNPSVPASEVTSAQQQQQARSAPALPPHLQVVQVLEADGRYHYQVMEAPQARSLYPSPLA
jgi:hypothetical protein